MSAYEVPLTAQPQKLAIALGSVTYNLTLMWNTIAQYWVIDIDDISNNPIIQGIPLVCGTNLLAQYDYLNFQGGLYAQTDNALGVVPAYSNLGTESHLYFVTD